MKPARTFLNRMLILLRENFEKDTIFLNTAFFKDLNWFHTFLRQFNGVVYYDIKPVQAALHLDASLTGMGGIFENQCYALPIPKNFQNYSIVHLEMVNWAFEHGVPIEVIKQQGTWSSDCVWRS